MWFDSKYLRKDYSNFIMRLNQQFGTELAVYATAPWTYLHSRQNKWGWHRNQRPTGMPSYTTCPRGRLGYSHMAMCFNSLSGLYVDAAIIIQDRLKQELEQESIDMDILT